MNEKLPFEKMNMCNAKLRCIAESLDQQRGCKYFVESEAGRINCVLLSFGFDRCCSPEANSEALDRLINAVKEQL